MKTVDVKSAAVFPNPHGVDAREIYNTPNALTVHIILKPGEALKRYITPVNVFFYVLESRGTVEIGDEKREVGPGTLIESPAKIVHCWYNTGDTNLRILVVKVPRPIGPAQIL